MNSLIVLLIKRLQDKKGLCIFFTVTLLNSLTITLKLNAFNPFDNTITGVDANGIPIIIKIQDIVSIKFSIGKCCDNKTFAYVINYGSSNVSVIDTSTNIVVDTISIGALPRSIAATPDGSRIYITQVSIPEVTVIDTSTNNVVDTISFGGGDGLGIGVTPDGSRAYVGIAYNNSQQPNTFIVDTTTNNVVGNVFPPNGGQAFAFNPDGTRLYRTDLFRVSVIDTSTNNLIKSILPAPGTDGLLGIAITPDGSTAYITNFSTSNVSVIDLSTNVIIKVIPVDFAPSGVAITPDGARVYVSTANNVAVIDTSNNLVITTIPNVKGQFFLSVNEIAITPDGSLAYVANETTNTVSVINTSSNTVIETIQVGATPNGIAIINKCV